MIKMEAEAVPIIIIIKEDQPVRRVDRKARMVWDLRHLQVSLITVR